MISSDEEEHFPNPVVIVPDTPESKQVKALRERLLDSDFTVRDEQHQSEDAYDAVEQLDAEHCRQVYLVTYSRADEKKVSSRENFAEILLMEFGKDRVVKWVCCAEPHTASGFHYHFAVKLTRDFRWKSVKNRLTEKYGIVVNFQNFTSGYNSAYRYVTKKDYDFVLSDGHDLDESLPQSQSAMTERRRSSVSKSSQKRRRKIDLISFNDMIIENNIRTDEQLGAFCKTRRKQGDPDTFQHYLSQPEARRVTFLKSVWKMEQAQSKLDRKALSRIELLENAQNGECVKECQNRAWYDRAIDNLAKNGVPVDEFASDIYQLLDKG